MNLLETRWQRYLDHLEEREVKRARQLPGWRTRRHRRRLTMMVAGANVVMITGAAFAGKQGDLTVFLPWLVGYLIWQVPFALLRILTGKMSGSFSVGLDERERDWRHRVSYVGYQVLTVLMVVAMIYLFVIAHQENAAQRGAIMLSALLMLGTSIPTIVLGWTLPDDVPEDSIA
ncbi:hypothetical protein [Amycolatopsis sp. GM8]|uniref:hypothetical protein n=1 Tax=Amycolatopsis sp. GM8 TaxID=2896530 RepID=UPI001F2A8BC9|nr:hypothetical protein [Amycolatopsis sp. GM8]